MECFYLPELDEQCHETVLRGDEFHHLRVLRYKLGDTLLLTNGEGLLAIGKILAIERDSARILVEQTSKRPGEPPFHLIVAFGMLASQERMEWLVEKCTELGVTRIIPVILDRCQRKHLQRRDRFIAKMIAAMKQSQRSVLPHLDDPVTLEQLLTTSHGTLIACVPTGKAPHVPLQNCTVIIGTEGGFSPNEERLLEEHNVQRWSLGGFRLRTETAAVVASSIIRIAWHKLA